MSVRITNGLVSGSSVSRIFAEFFLKTVYPIMIGENFHIYGSNITGKYICESNN